MAGGASAAAGQRALDAAGIPQFLTPENAVDALALLQRFAVNQQKLRQAPVAIDEGFVPDVAAAEAIRRTALAEGRTLLDEVESKALLGHFGLAAPPSIVASDPQGAAEAAKRLGFPVVLKVLSPDIAHKSDVGGVRINVQSAAAARAAAEDILESVARLRPQAPRLGRRRAADGAHPPPARGLPRHGHRPDVRRGDRVRRGRRRGRADRRRRDRAAALNALLARSLVNRTRFAKLLRAYRNVPGVDFPQLEQTLVRFSGLVCACPWIASLDINRWSSTRTG